MLAAMKTQKSICAENLRALRKSHDLSQAELAELLGTEPMIISTWERGLYLPSGKYLTKLSSIFKVSAEQILGMNGFDPAPIPFMPTIIDVMEVLDGFKNAPTETRNEVLAILGKRNGNTRPKE